TRHTACRQTRKTGGRRPQRPPRTAHPRYDATFRQAPRAFEVDSRDLLSEGANDDRGVAYGGRRAPLISRTRRRHVRLDTARRTRAAPRARGLVCLRTNAPGAGAAGTGVLSRWTSQ